MPLQEHRWDRVTDGNSVPPYIHSAITGKEEKVKTSMKRKEENLNKSCYCRCSAHSLRHLLREQFGERKTLFGVLKNEIKKPKKPREPIFFIKPTHP
jgi:hypothetical protein